MLNKNKMKKKPQRKETLADKIAGVLSATPKSYDPEDEVEETSAKVVDDVDDDGDDSDVEELLSKFRKQNIDLLEDVDTRYAGKKGSRKALKDESDDEGEEMESDDEAASSDEVENSSDDGSSMENDAKSDSGESFEDLEATDKSDANFKHLKTTNQSTQKGTCVKNQLNIWENLLEIRIQLQKSLISSNKLPQFDTYKNYKQSPEFQKKTAEVTNSVGNMLSKMLELQTLCINKYPETKNVLKGSENTKTNDDDDEEIPSDTDEETKLSDDEVEPEQKQPKKKKLKLSDYETEIQKIHDSYTPARNSIIQKWNDKTRIATGIKTAGHSVLNQIEHALNDRDKLIKRTQLKRSVYQIYGKPENKNATDSAVSNDEYDTEIFDDDDFYHQLLRELIEVKSADLTDPVQLGRQWMQLQNLRNKLKRKIDTKATKGRKIRYAIHPKLVNYMAPIDEEKWTDEARTELFSSLFGQAHKSS